MQRSTAILFSLIVLIISQSSFAADPTVTLDFRSGAAQGSWQVQPANPTNFTQITISGPSSTYYAGAAMYDKASVQIDTQLKMIVMSVASDAQQLIIGGPMGLGHYVFATIQVDNLPAGNWSVRCMFPSFPMISPAISFTVSQQKYSGGDGSQNNPWKISTKQDLLDLGNNTADYNDCFIMTNDINLAPDVYTTAIIARDYAKPFKGLFDGADFKISGLTIDSDNDHVFIGLFGCIDGGLIKNLGLKDISVHGISGVGGLVGFNSGNISNCYSTGSVSGLQTVGGLVGQNMMNISGSYSTADVTGNDILGGLAGTNEWGYISNSYSQGFVNGSTYNIGGFVGINASNILNCYSIGDVNGFSLVGGLAGQNFGGDIANSYSRGFVNGVDGVGGLVGTNFNNNMLNCYFTGDVNGISNVGNLVGRNSSHVNISNCFWNIETQTHGITQSIGLNSPNETITNVLPLTTAQMQKKSTYTTAPANWDFLNTWRLCSDSQYPILSWQHDTPGDFTCPDGIDLVDFAALGSNWKTQTGSDFPALILLAQNWLSGF